MRSFFKKIVELISLVLVAILVGWALFYVATKTDLGAKLGFHKIASFINNEDAKPLEQKGDLRTVIQEAVPNLYIFDDRVGRKLKPNTTVHFKTPYFDTTITTNKDGFTGRNYPFETKNYRVAILGDSWVEAYGVTDTSRFPHMTEQYIYNKTQGKLRVDVMGFGVSGWGLGQQYAAIKHFVLKYKPDEIWVSFLITNDAGDNTPLMTPPPVGPTFIYSETEPDKIVDITFGYNALPSAVMDDRQKRYGDLLNDTWKDWTFGLLPYYWSTERNPKWDVIMDHTYQTLRLIKELCDKEGIKVSLIYRNTGYDSSQSNYEAFEKEAHAFIGKEIEMDRKLGFKRFRKRVEGMGISIINTLEMPPLTRSGEASSSKHAAFGNFFADVIIDRLSNEK